MTTPATNFSETDFNQLDRYYAKVGDMQRLEGRFDTELKHLATKSDVQIIKTDLVTMKSDLQFMIFKMTGALAAFITVILAVFEFLID